MNTERRRRRSVLHDLVVFAMAPLAAWASVGCADGGEEIAEAQSAVTSATRSLVVPAYLTQDPTIPESLWSNAMPKYTGGVYIVNGPANGPPNDGSLTAAVNDLMNHGTAVLGYVNYAAGTPIATIRSQVALWHSWYPQLSGIFFDNSIRSTDNDIPDFENVLMYTQGIFGFYQNSGTVYFNNGGFTAFTEKYVDCLIYHDYGGYPGSSAAHQRWVTFEGDDYTYRGTDWTNAAHGWIHNYSAWRFINLIYSAPVDGSTLHGLGSIEYILAYANASSLYVTDQFGPPTNTWGRRAKDPVWTNEQDSFSQQPYTGYFGRDLGSEIFAYGPSQCPPPTP
jgi:hypothetical protein